MSAAAESPPREGGGALNRPLVVASIMLATIMQAIDTTIANVAVPHMQGSLAATQDQIAWVLTSYIVAAAIMTPLTGWLAGRYGRKRVFAVSVAGFTVASMACGAAATLEQMVLFRLMQGVFGAALVPLSQAVLLDIYPRRKHGRAMAIWGTGIMVGPILGPTLGGWLTEAYDWRWVFYINLPFGILALLGILIFVHDSASDRDRPFDLFGFAFLSLAVGALQLMLDRGQHKDWFESTEIVIECGLAAIGLWVFLVHSFTAKQPFVDPALFRDRNFTIGLALMFVTSAVTYATLALTPPMLALLQYPAAEAGLLMAPRGVATMAMMVVAGRIMARIDIRLILASGFGLVGLSLAQMAAFSPNMDEWPIVVSGLVQGAGLGLLYVPLSTATFSTLPGMLRAEGSGIFSLLRNIGGSIGIAVAIAWLARATQGNQARLGEHLNWFDPAMRGGAWPLPFTLDSATGAALADRMIHLQAAMLAFLEDYRLMMYACIAAIPLVLLLRPPRRNPAAAAQPAPALE